MKRTIALFAVLILISSILSACQPTPTTPPVVGKANDLEAKIKETANPQQENTIGGIPGSVRDNLNHAKLTVNIDARVELPGVSQIPVVKVAPDTFTQEQADKIIQTLMQGKPIYEPSEVRTRAQLQEEIVRLKATIADGTARNKERISEQIAELEKALASAPESAPGQPATGKFKAEEGAIKQIEITADLGKVNDARLVITASESGKICNVWFTNGDALYNFQSALSETPRGMNMTLDEAQALAVKTAEDMGSELKLEAVMLGSQGETGLQSGPPVVDEDAPQAYIFWFTREVDGVPTIYETNDGSSVEVPDDATERVYFEPYPYERMSMVIDDTGIVELHWTSPVKILETISPSAQILPFDQVMEKSVKQFFVHNALKTNDADINQYTYTVDRITLGLTRIPVKDKPNEYMLVPVWDFFGMLKTEFNDQSKPSEIFDHSATSFLTINAIDGSVIDRASGN